MTQRRGIGQLRPLQIWVRLRGSVLSDRVGRMALAVPMDRYGLATWRWLGLAGSVMVAAGGLLAGVAPARDYLLLLPAVDELRDSTVFATAVVFRGLTWLL